MAKPKKETLNDLCLKIEPLSNASPERPLCQKCGLFREAQTPFLGPYIPPDWDGTILMFGEAPGADEDQRSKRPFSGKAGQFLERLREETGLTERSVALANANMCRPFGNKTPTMTQVRCCRPFVLGLIDSLQPKTVVALGTTAVRSLTNDGQATVTNTRGRPLAIPGLPKTPENPSDNG